jgi:membrane fusion protein (multidrug efflux system)
MMRPNHTHGDARALRAPEGSSGPAPLSEQLRRRRLVQFDRALKIKIGVVCVIVLAVGIWGYSWIQHRLDHVSEEDARVAADMIAVASRFDGWTTRIPVIQGQKVKKGDVLVEIDSRAAQLKLAELIAQVDELRAQRATLAAEMAMTEAQTTHRLEAQRYRVAAGRAAVQAARSRNDFVRSEYNRIQSLAASRVVSSQALEKSAADLKDASEKLAQTTAELAVAEAQLAEAEAARQQSTVLQRRIEQLIAEEERLNAVQDQQRLEISDRTIVSPIDGVVDKLFLNPSEFVRPGQRLMLLHDPDAVWIDANVRETDVRRIQMGAEVKVTVDAYPDRTFTGKVIHIGSSATSQYALLPNPNPSGNFTKIVQRLPIKVKVEEAGELLRPGMMVEISVVVPDR